MSLEAALWTLTTMFAGGVQVFLQKVIAHEGRSNGLNGAFMYAGPTGVALVALLFVGIPTAWQMVTLYAVLSGAVYSIGNYVRVESFKYIDTVLYLPLNKVLGPLLVIAGSLLFLGESLTRWQVLGVAFSVCVPLLLISSTEKHRQNNLKLGLLFLVASTALMSASYIFNKPGLALDQSVFFFMFVSQATGFVLSMAFHLRSNKNESHLASLTKRRDWELGALTMVISVIALYALLKAISIGQLSLVYTIQAHYILIPIILSVWWYGEHINARKLFAVVVSFLAIGLLI